MLRNLNRLTKNFESYKRSINFIIISLLIYKAFNTAQNR